MWWIPTFWRFGLERGVEAFFLSQHGAPNTGYWHLSGVLKGTVDLLVELKVFDQLLYSSKPGNHETDASTAQPPVGPKKSAYDPAISCF